MSDVHDFRCGTCGRRGHNSRTCPEAGPAPVTRKRKPPPATCKAGHELDAKNLRIPKDKEGNETGWQCRACCRGYTKKWLNTKRCAELHCGEGGAAHCDCPIHGDRAEATE